MWRNLAKQAKTITKNHPFLSSSRTPISLGLSQESAPSHRFSSSGYGPIRPEEGSQRRPSLGFSRNHIGPNGVFVKRYRIAAVAVEEDGEEVKELLKEMIRAKKNLSSKKCRRQRIEEHGMQDRKYLWLRKRQIKVETEAWEQTANDYRDLMSDTCAQKLAPSLPYMKSLLLGWYEPLCDAIVREREIIKEKRAGLGHGKYFDLLPADKMALITMHKLMAMLMAGGGSARVVTACCAIGEAIENEVRINKFLEKTKKKKGGKNKENEVQFDAGVNEQDKLRKQVDILMKRQKKQKVNKILKGQDDSKPWGMEIKAKVGSRLVELFIEAAYLQSPVSQLADAPPDIRPAFVHTYQYIESTPGVMHKMYGVIQCDPEILKGIEKTLIARHLVIPYMPMLVPPVKWTGYDKGAHLVLPSYVMRTHGSWEQREVFERAPKKQLESIYEALNVLGSTKWRVNNSVISVVERIWNSGGGLAGLVDRTDTPLPIKPDTDDEVLLKQWKWAFIRLKKENAEKHSLRCDTELKLEVARKMKNEEGFYYPHNIDFRGRAYPMHPYLNHLGSDVCRGILEFAEGRVLGKSGLRWLKIQLANLYAGGVDKLPLEGRIAFTESHLNDIFDSADLPLEGRCWWLNAQDPFQCLAVCINLAEALRSSSPETCVSHIPVHQDGSCNGVQHYAALGRDKLVAAAVNLIAGEKPADVYSDIAARVLDIIQKDAERDPESFPDALHARILISQVDRKLVKQTVMTSAYGVTYTGARDQIKQRLKERGVIKNEKLVFKASCYAAKVVLTALGDMFESARSIMGWLADCAKIIAGQNVSVCWTTPLGLPAVQPYRILGKQLVRTSLQVLTLQRETDEINVEQQKNAFPPNFIHSLDSSHMMMTALACKKAGLNFSGVHDSYWTHACNVDEMNRLLREKFVQLYEKPILENLLESFQKSYPELQFPPLPERGDLDLKDVLESPYFFN